MRSLGVDDEGQHLPSRRGSVSLFGRHEPATFDEFRERLIVAARACRAWTELDRSELVERERGFFIRVETDEVFRAYSGDAFSGAGMVVSSLTPLYFTVDETGIRILERQPETWSQLTYARARAKAAR